jgi:hypothetical protein
MERVEVAGTPPAVAHRAAHSQIEQLSASDDSVLAGAELRYRRW